ncbi:hypothetical protein [Desulfopila inferna]|uniref:hypothetical protein n=1 Tax=Desulfopila inferna TaxID=468528 RepID=UPI0019637CAE|nr:hypothetical protein [Desulfopila inferna]MBM9605626.1 hypothetical protein [Desulfopila inferna]
MTGLWRPDEKSSPGLGQERLSFRGNQIMYCNCASSALPNRAPESTRRELEATAVNRPVLVALPVALLLFLF